MTVDEQITFLPDWVSPPGDTIRDLLEERKQTPSQFAELMGVSTDVAKKLLSGSVPIDNQLADALARIFEVPAQFWHRREHHYREAELRVKRNEEWLNELPVRDLTKLKWIKPCTRKPEKISACLEFFGVATVADWRAEYENNSELTAFRTSTTFESSPGAVLAWLRKGELESQQLNCTIWNAARFRDALPEIRTLTRQSDPAIFIPELKKLCASCGVAVVIAKTPTGCRASGATRFLPTNVALLMLSFRYLSNDHFWFTFFHEAGHLLLHTFGAAPLLEGEQSCSAEQSIEDEANEFACTTLVPREHDLAMRELPLNKVAIVRFAKKVGIAPGIVVGQLQYRELLERQRLNWLKKRYIWLGDTIFNRETV